MGQKDSLMGSVVGWWLHEIQNLNILSFTAYLVLGPARQMRCTVPKKIVVYLYIVSDHNFIITSVVLLGMILIFPIL